MTSRQEKSFIDYTDRAVRKGTTFYLRRHHYYLETNCRLLTITTSYRLRATKTEQGSDYCFQIRLMPLLHQSGINQAQLQPRMRKNGNIKKMPASRRQSQLPLQAASPCACGQLGGLFVKSTVRTVGWEGHQSARLSKMSRRAAHGRALITPINLTGRVTGLSPTARSSSPTALRPLHGGSREFQIQMRMQQVYRLRKLLGSRTSLPGLAR